MKLEDIFGWLMLIAFVGIGSFLALKPQNRLSRGLSAFFHSPGIVSLGKGIRLLFIWVFLILLGFALLSYWLTPEQQRIVNEYHISKDKVFIEPKPHGCDFNDAPLGNKHCHYEKKQEVAKDEQGHVTSVYVYWNKVQE